MTATISLVVNGRPEVVRAEGAQTLAEALRQDLGLLGVREACGIGVCGSCTVIANGRAMSACLLLAALADGLEVTTVEGLSDGSGLDPVQQAFLDHAAFQCSYCTPGFILATRALLAEDPRPTPDRVRSALAGNLCRCGSYPKILEAVLDAADRLAPAVPG